MPVARELLSMFEFSRNHKTHFPLILMNVLHHNKEVYPQINKPFRCIDIHNRKAYIALWVHPFTHVDGLSLDYGGLGLIW